MNTETIQVIMWWGTLVLLGITSFPTTFLLFRKFTDKGYAFSKLIGLLVPAYLIFLGSIFKIIPLDLNVILTAFLAYLGVNLFIYLKNSKAIKRFLIQNTKTVLLQEIIFGLGYLLWVIVRGHQPDIIGLEKFMDLGFINSILRTKYLPPTDMWAAGEVINYYWFGHYLTALLTKLSRIPSHVTYNLMLATILGMTLSMSQSIVFNLIKSLKEKLSFRKAFFIGIISAVLLAFGGNLHTPIYIFKQGTEEYWYPDATRFIGYHPETEDKTIHEFPLYSFVVSDLHAHLINLPLVLLYIALLWRLVAGLEKNKQSSVVEIIPSGLLIGVMFMTSAWDFANYSLLTGIALLLFMYKKYGLKIETILETAKYVFIYLLVAALTVLPFMINFQSLAEGIKFVNAQTPLWQLGVLWGFPAIMTAIFSWILIRIKKPKAADLFIISMLITAWILIFLPEIIYVKDIYIASHHRANTMFKLTYQAFVIFYLSVGYIVYRSIDKVKQKENRVVLALVYLVLFGAILSYPYFAVRSYYNRLDNYQGLSGEQWMQRRYPGYYNAVLWLRDNINGQPVILEAQGDSYTDYNMVSAYTGLPTVNGWYVHEWLWRGTSDFPQQRAVDITQIYNSNSVSETKRLLDHYNVEFVIVGPLEREKYTRLDEQKFGALGSSVFESDDVAIYKVK